MLELLEKKNFFLLCDMLDHKDLNTLKLVSRFLNKSVTEYNHLSGFLKLIEQYQQENPTVLIDLLQKKLIHPELISSLMVRLIDTYPETNTPRLTYHGLTLVDSLSPQSLLGLHRSSVMIYPFPAPKVAAMMIYYAKVQDEEYIVFIKSKRRSDGISKELALPGGNLNVIGPFGAEQGVSRVEDKIRDEAEEQIMKGNSSAYQTLQTSPSRNSLPLQPERYHQSLKDCAKTEGVEETGINITESIKESALFVCQKEYLSRSRRMHLILHYFVTDCGSFDHEEDLPNLLPQDEYEVESAQWIKVGDITVSTCPKDFSGVTFQLSYQDNSIAKPHLDGLNQSLRFIRDKEIQRRSRGCYSGMESLYHTSKQADFKFLEPFVHNGACEFDEIQTANHIKLCNQIENLVKIKKDCSDSMIKKGLIGFGLFALGAASVLITQHIQNNGLNLGSRS
ncbi:NUDIX hydrolase [Legionella sp. WA2024007413]